MLRKLLVCVLIENANAFDTQLPVAPWSKMDGNLGIAKVDGTDGMVFVVVNVLVFSEETTLKMS
jgi:hypothetical protein